jgi:hypothetical protein
MPTLGDDDRERIEEFHEFLRVARRLTLDKGGRTEVDGAVVEFVSMRRAPYGLGGCGNNVGWRAAVRIDGTRVVVGPGPSITEHAGWRLAVDPDSIDGRLLLAVAKRT